MGPTWQPSSTSSPFRIRSSTASQSLKYWDFLRVALTRAGTKLREPQCALLFHPQRLRSPSHCAVLFFDLGEQRNKLLPSPLLIFVALRLCFARVSSLSSFAVRSSILWVFSSLISGSNSLYPRCRTLAGTRRSPIRDARHPQAIPSLVKPLGKAGQKNS